jgi:hypothetical protein
MASENAIDRITGIREFAFREFDRGISDFLYNILINDKFYGVRCEAASTLGKLRHKLANDVLMRGYDIQTHPKVKREILKALANSNSNDETVLKFVLRKIKDEKNDYIVSDGIDALVKLAKPENLYEYVTPFMKRESHRNVVMASVIDALKAANKVKGDSRMKEYFKEIGFGIDIPGRLRAEGLKALKPFAKDEDVKALAKKYIDFNARFIKSEMIMLLGESEDKSMIEFLTGMKKNTSDERIYKNLTSAIKKLNGEK